MEKVPEQAALGDFSEQPLLRQHSSDSFGHGAWPLASPGAIVTQGSQASSGTHLQVPGGSGLLEVYTYHCWRLPESSACVLHPNPCPARCGSKCCHLEPISPCPLLDPALFLSSGLQTPVWGLACDSQGNFFQLLCHIHPNCAAPNLSASLGGVQGPYGAGCVPGLCSLMTHVPALPLHPCHSGPCSPALSPCSLSFQLCFPCPHTLLGLAQTVPASASALFLWLSSLPIPSSLLSSSSWHEEGQEEGIDFEGPCAPSWKEGGHAEFHTPLTKGWIAGIVLVGILGRSQPSQSQAWAWEPCLQPFSLDPGPQCWAPLDGLGGVSVLYLVP